MIMPSAGELRRAFLAIFLLSIFLVFYLLWQQPNIINGIPQLQLQGQLQHNPSTYVNFRKTNKQWTWKCVNQRCERAIKTLSEPQTSMATCSMLCGSTQLWPQPTGPVTLGSRTTIFHHTQLEFQTSAVEPALTYVLQSFAFFNSNIITMVQKSDYQIQKSDIDKFIIKVSIIYSNETSQLIATDESYKLTVRTGKRKDLIATITAKTFFGSRHGLETLSQLIWWDEFAEDGGLSIVKGVTIEDAPKFPYRGLMIDTSRNFMPLDYLKRIVIGMAANKLNVFHWHISDSQSFPLVLPSVPLLAKYGAYGPDMIYSPENIKQFVEFARIHGVRTIIEVDTPAHAGNGWTWGPDQDMDDLAVCVNAQPWSLYCGEPPCGQLNPHNPKVYDILEKIYKDLIELTGENELFHIGGDEVNLDCWSHFLVRTAQFPQNYTDLHDLWGEFTLKALNRLKIANKGALPKHVIVWSSNLSRKPYNIKYLKEKEIVVQIWGASSWSETPSLLSDGYKIIISHVDAWYLDCGFGAWRETGGAACDPYRPWQVMYSHQPWSSDPQYRKQMLGGEACLWTEQVDALSLDSRLWPRAAAFSERLWSDPPASRNFLIPEDVYTRLSTHRERLVGRGLQAEALWPQWCAQNPGMCL